MEVKGRKSVGADGRTVQYERRWRAALNLRRAADLLVGWLLRHRLGSGGTYWVLGGSLSRKERRGEGVYS